jgi:hypothetical protein
MKYDIKAGDIITWNGPTTIIKKGPYHSVVEDVFNWGIQTKEEPEHDGSYWRWNVRTEEILTINGISTRFMLTTGEMIKRIKMQRAIIIGLTAAVLTRAAIDIVIFISHAT